MTRKKKGAEKGSNQSRTRCNGKSGKKEQENPKTQAKMFCTEAASHEKNGNYNRALHCYDLLMSVHRFAVTDGLREKSKICPNKISHAKINPSFISSIKVQIINFAESVYVPWQPKVKAFILVKCLSPKVQSTPLKYRLKTIVFLFGEKSLRRFSEDYIMIKEDIDAEENGAKVSEDEEKAEDELEDDEEKKTDAEVTEKVGVKAPKKVRRKKNKKISKPTKDKTEDKTKKHEAKPPSPRVSSKSTFTQIAKELKARRLAQMAHAAAMAKKRKKNRVLRDEEVYTDKDRAAAVNMGTTDIKQSLKMKKKLDKNPGSQIPEEAEPATLLALGNNELRNGDLKTALKFMNKALQLNPDDKNGLVARSKCYLSLGDPRLALMDAETALKSDKTFVKAIYQKAEALYHLGDFEHSLMYYHRGHRLRPELECFRLGVQKAQEAIENTIGGAAKLNSRKAEKALSSSSSSAKTEESMGSRSKGGNDTKRSVSSLGSEKSHKRSKSAAPTVKSSSRFIGELVADRLYLENLLKHPDLICSNQQAASIIKRQAEEGITFLKSRQEFWRQQRPNTSSAKTVKNNSQKEWSQTAEEN